MILKVGIIGIGSIGNYLAERIIESGKFELSAVYDIDESRYHEFSRTLNSPIPLLPISQFPDDTDIFIECASVDAVEDVVKEGLSRGKTVIIASIGGLLDKPSLWDIINSSNGKLILPSCAIGGLDILKAIPKGDIEELTLTTRKNPKSLLKEFSHIDSKVEIFSSNAGEAVRKFPRNINVAALLSIAGIGPDRTKVKIIADPDVEQNIHEVFIKSKSGNYKITCENFPFESNPKSSKLAAQSIWASLDYMDSHISIGL
jgi:aspartate dehydrogenase